MAKVISKQDIRYINLFEKITKIRPITFFNYNGSLIFIVPQTMVSKAIGEGGKNAKKLSSILSKKIKVIAQVNSDKDIEKFISLIIQPNIFSSLEVNEDEIILSASKQVRSIIIGRNKTKLKELKKISEDYLNKEIKIV